MRRELDGISTSVASVEEGAQIDGVDSGAARSFHYVVRMALPLTDFVGVVEVHHGTEPADASWLETVVAKSRDVSADLIVAVSNRGFDDAAVRRAQRERVRLWSARRPDLRHHSLILDPDLPSSALIQVVQAQLHPLIAGQDAAVLDAAKEPVRLVIPGREVEAIITEAFRRISPRDPVEVLRANAGVDDKTFALVVMQLPRTSGFHMQMAAGETHVDLAGAVLQMELAQSREFEFDSNLEWLSNDGSRVLHLASTSLEGEVYVHTHGRGPGLGIGVSRPGIPLFSVTLTEAVQADLPLREVRLFVGPTGLVHTTVPDEPTEPMALEAVSAWIEARGLVAVPLSDEPLIP